MVGTRLRAGLGLAIAQLRYYRVRTVLTVVAIALAVLSTTLLASVGAGVVETGTDRLDRADRDLWMTGGPLRIAPGSVGGFENAIVGAHRLRADLNERDDVRVAVPLAFHTVYAGTDPDDLRTVVGVGVPGGGPSIAISRGETFRAGDAHYAGGAYDGPMSRELLVDERTAERFDVDVGDRLYVGGTLANARRNAFVVRGVTPTFSRFLGTPTVAMHLSELQTLVGTTGTDRAGLVTITLVDGADPEAVAAELERAYPDYDVRTNREQLRSFLRERAIVIASGVALVGIAVVAGIALTVNVMSLIVYHQRREFAALKAAGVSSRTLLVAVAGQATVMGGLGAGLGLALSPPAVVAVNLVAERLTGFAGIAQLADWMVVVGVATAIGIGSVGALAAGWRVLGVGPLDQLRG